jgi:hypothetical protein
LNASQASDISLKKNVVSLVTDISNVYDKLIHLDPVHYEWINGSATDVNKVKYGFIANEVQKVIPGIVSTLKDASGNDILGYDPVSLIPFIVSGIKKQNDDILELRQKNNALEERIALLEKSTNVV